ncbi:VOC family protein [Pseudoclavibacter endophyticus]|uniref:VOC family protein n=2 Tax=Pseudoclavibacter endophyticus TaxID=1778590 RepID=A0A6H9WTL9_9MICO|nr:VOC family protein [Pseudoclavibacter endophyticus]KAB1650035.1 VOC family protein [Pseudoclavibacter endophyticus]
MGRIIHFEITADDPESTARFYADAFGWQSETSPFVPGYHLVDTGDGNGINGAVMSREYRRQPAILWLEVDDIRDSVAAVEAAGGRHDGAVNEIPGQGLVTYVTDPSGTAIGLKQPLH